MEQENLDYNEFKWGVDQFWTNSIFIPILTSDDLQIQGNYSGVLQKYRRSWDIISNLMENKINATNKDEIAKYMEEMEQLFEVSYANCIDERLGSQAYLQQVNMQKRVDLIKNIERIHKLLWKYANFVGLSLKTQIKIHPSEAIRKKFQ